MIQATKKEEPDVEEPVKMRTPASELEAAGRSKGGSDTDGMRRIVESLHFGLAETQGKRDSMEDTHVALVNLEHSSGRKCAFFGVYDGHGGRRASEFLAEQLHAICLAREDFLDSPADVLAYAVAQTEAQFMDIAAEENLQDGSTLVAALVYDGGLVACNVGDAEMCLASKDRVFSLSEIHNPSKNPQEVERVQTLGGRVYTNRVGHHRLGHPYLNPSFFNLGVSRAIGDVMYKNSKFTDGKASGLVADPHVVSVELDWDADDFFVLACDGLWDVVTHAEASEFILTGLERGDSLQEITSAIVGEALRKGSTDNISVIVVSWKSFV